MMIAVQPGESLRGRLLVAGPMLRDPNFHRTVVLVLEHTDDGALGVVLNRPSATRLDEALPAWADHAAEPAVLFVGGPVGLGGAIGIGHQLGAGDAVADAPVVGQVGVLDLDLDPLLTGPGVAPVRIFTGYAGWAAGQLEDELAGGDWAVVAAEPTDPLAPRPDRLWQDVLRRQPGRLAWWANIPPDVRMN